MKICGRRPLKKGEVVHSWIHCLICSIVLLKFLTKVSLKPQSLIQYQIFLSVLFDFFFLHCFALWNSSSLAFTWNFVFPGNVNYQEIKFVMGAFFRCGSTFINSKIIRFPFSWYILNSGDIVFYFLMFAHIEIQLSPAESEQLLMWEFVAAENYVYESTVREAETQDERVKQILQRFVMYFRQIFTIPQK